MARRRRAYVNLSGQQANLQAVLTGGCELLTDTTELFPPVLSTVKGSDTVSSASHDLSLPAGVQTGDLLIQFVSVDGNPSITWPVDWNTLFYGAQGGNCFGIACKEADGSEGGIVTVTLGSGQGVAWIGYRIGEHLGISSQLPEVSTIANGVSQNPDPNSLTPTGGPNYYLWLAACSMDGGDAADAFPTNYIGTLTEGPGLEAGIASCHRLLNASSEDPGSFTKSEVEDWVAVTVAVHPSSVEGGGWTSGGVRLTTEIRMAAVFSSSVDILTALTTEIIFVSSITANGDLISDLTTESHIASQISCDVNIAADLTTEIRFTSQITGNVNIVSSMTTEVTLAAVIIGGCDIASSLATETTFSSILTADGDLAADLIIQINFDAILSMEADISGSLTTEITTVALLVGSADIDADLNTGQKFDAVISLSAQVSSALTTGIPIAAEVSCEGNISSNITTEITVASEVSLNGDISAYLTGLELFQVGISGSGDINANLTTTAPLRATITGNADLISAITTEINFSSIISNNVNLAPNFLSEVRFKSNLTGSCLVMASLEGGQDAALFNKEPVILIAEDVKASRAYSFIGPETHIKVR